MKRAALDRALDDALAHVEALIAEANGDPTTSRALGGLSDDQRASVRRYVESWIEHPLRLALVLAREAEGSGSFRVARTVGYLDRTSAYGRRLTSNREAALEAVL